MTRIIGIISGKGGVGKTTTVANLGAALVDYGKRVVILDGNITTPNLSLHLGIPLYPVTLHDVLKKKAPIESAIYEHPSGIKIIPASLSVDAFKGINIDRFESVLWSLLGKADIIIIDAAAGLGKEAMAAIEASDELVIVTNPELTAVTDALKTIQIAATKGTKVLGVVVNRHRGHRHEMSLKSIEEMLEVPILAVVPEDLAVPKSIAKKIPVVEYRPSSKAAREFRRLAEEILYGQTEIVHRKKGLIYRLFSWLS